MMTAAVTQLTPGDPWSSPHSTSCTRSPSATAPASLLGGESGGRCRSAEYAAIIRSSTPINIGGPFLFPCGDTSIHRQQRPCNPRRLVTRKEKNRSHHVLWLTVPAKWMEGVKAREDFSDLLRRQERTVNGSLYDCWRYGINPDAIFCKFDRKIACQRVDSCLCGRISARWRQADRLSRPHRADVYDRPTPTLSHCGDCGLRSKECAF